MWPPRSFSALPPVILFLRLALKLFRGEPAISEFDWNFSAIHKSSPHFSTYVRFGPPRRLTAASACSWIGHPVSGLLRATIRPFETRFPFGSVALRLNLAAHCNSPARSTKSTRSLSLPLLVNTRFQVLFHSPPGVLFTFPSRYYFAIGHQVVFSLGGWSPRLPTGFLVSCGTLDTRLTRNLRLRGCYPLWLGFPTNSASLLRNPASPKPRSSVDARFGLFPFRSPLL